MNRIQTLRFIDIILSLIGLLLLSMLFIVVALLIKIDSKGNIIYIQKRIGKNGVKFNLYKFRTMFNGSESKGTLTIGLNDTRITRLGYFLRKYKIDELPQLFNVLTGQMSIIGPRPLVNHENANPKIIEKLLSVRPGISDFATIMYLHQEKHLKFNENLENVYNKIIIPKRYELSLKYIENPSIRNYFRLILLTLYRIFV